MYSKFSFTKFSGVIMGDVDGREVLDVKGKFGLEYDQLLEYTHYEKKPALTSSFDTILINLPSSPDCPINGHSNPSSPAPSSFVSSTSASSQNVVGSGPSDNCCHLYG